jgi:hypothetical protein
MVPKNFFGETLYPLNDLKSVNEEIYRTQIAKYQDHPYRRTLPSRRLPKLGCLWNDVVHFSPINPRIVYDTWQSLGVSLDDLEWFAIPIENLPQGKTAVYHYRPENFSVERAEELDDEYSLLDLKNYEELTELRRETVEFYRDWIAQGRRGAFFAFVPHILVQGPVSVHGAKRFSWKTI